MLCLLSSGLNPYLVFDFLMRVCCRRFYVLVSAASEALGLVAMTEDFGDKSEAKLYADASAAIGVANRDGLGRIRHLDTQPLWLQQALRKRRLGLGKVLGTEKPSDWMTKHVDSKLLGQHVTCMG